MALSLEKHTSPSGQDHYPEKHWEHDSERGDPTIKPVGVRKAEAAQKVITGKHKVLLVIRYVHFLALVSYRFQFTSYLIASGWQLICTLSTGQLLGHT